MDDEKIIELFFARSEEALDALAQKYGRLLRGVAGNVLADPRDTEECLNDAYLALWNKIPPEKPDPLSAYVCRVVRNLAVKRYHRNTAEKRNSA
ncbi:MAG: sigma-70 family RNA polymerase sigma factor, partial [Clostridia bacterium]|nr:sigma-70 family RNA polymerase sigma factor [Clostridia bacterium]